MWTSITHVSHTWSQLRTVNKDRDDMDHSMGSMGVMLCVNVWKTQQKILKALQKPAPRPCLLYQPNSINFAEVCLRLRHPFLLCNSLTFMTFSKSIKSNYFSQREFIILMNYLSSFKMIIPRGRSTGVKCFMLMKGKADTELGTEHAMERSDTKWLNGVWIAFIELFSCLYRPPTALYSTREHSHTHKSYTGGRGYHPGCHLLIRGNNHPH